MGMLLSFLASGLLHASQHHSKARCMLKSMGLILMCAAYILACIGLYYFWAPSLGVALSLAGIAGVLMATAFLFFFVARLLRPKATPLTKANTVMENALGQVTRFPLPVAAALAVGVGAFYLASSRARSAIKLLK